MRYRNASNELIVYRNCFFATLMYGWGGVYTMPLERLEAFIEDNGYRLS